MAVGRWLHDNPHTHYTSRDNCSLLGANFNQWCPVKYILYSHYITAHGYKRHPGNFYWALFFHMRLHCCGNFTGRVHGRVNTPNCALCPYVI